MKFTLFSSAMLALFSSQVMATACVISSNDDQLPIRMCQQNINIPPSLFTDSFCQPQIPDRSFDVAFTEACPEGAYGICHGAKTPGVAYEQAIHYYSDADDAPILKAYCENISEGRWDTP
ncbi:NADH:ubiquinone oxidoreductase [Halopseudomonas pelagia]|uniref:NADH:ubiquinone oxidoreductase n=1 Tax=Halopseudomonas pelagia TaxID=553151 RepID=A0AA91U4E4_9GAMM|nr:NADH:ubiquinone oxidoreductase [Halopseudomonas pelagia]PCD00585.1 NADH:ubiquinone oxidoreductase [Halopseudomonas pelagia]QFY55287.1 NADH:ubiquinone oxidoreductase [Halopseudomonas pelagia]WOD11279.1 NADH:ubiquinone oxidoreductase [Pseudomonas sp. NyZ704]